MVLMPHIPPGVILYGYMNRMNPSAKMMQPRIITNQDDHHFHEWRSSLTLKYNCAGLITISRKLPKPQNFR
jgi:hypothetical protein